MVKAAAKSSPPGESQTESHTATGRVRATRRGDQWKVTVRQADMRSTASPKPDTKGRAASTIELVRASDARA